MINKREDKKRQGSLQLMKGKLKRCQFPAGFYFPSQVPKSEASEFSVWADLDGKHGPVARTRHSWAWSWDPSFISCPRSTELEISLLCESFHKITDGDHQPCQLPHSVGYGQEEVGRQLGEEGFYTPGKCLLWMGAAGRGREHSGDGAGVRPGALWLVPSLSFMPQFCYLENDNISGPKWEYFDLFWG